MKLKIIGTFDNANVKNNGMVSMKFKFPYSEIANWSKLLMSIGMLMVAVVDTENGERTRLGKINFKQLNIDKDGEAKFVIDGETSGIELDKIYTMLDKMVVVKIKTISEDEENDEENGEENEQ